MLKLIRNIVPAGRTVRELEISRVTRKDEDAELDSVLLNANTRTNVASVLSATTPVRKKETTVEEGILRAVHLDNKWLEISKPDGSHRRFITKDDVLDDVVGPMVNRPVLVRAHSSSKTGALHLDDIELNEKQEEKTPDSKP